MRIFPGANTAIRRTGLAAISTIALALPAAAFHAINGHEVNALPSGAFEVIEEPGAGAADFWCGAGDFAFDVLRVAPNRQVFLIGDRAPSLTHPGRLAVTFALDLPPGMAPAPQTVTLSTKHIGEGLTATFAQQYCQPWLRFDS